jgi:hypothetical protein
VELTPSGKLRVDLGYGWYSLTSRNDRFQRAKVRDHSGLSGDEIGHKIDLRARWQITRKIELIMGYVYFQAGDFTQNTLSRDDLESCSCTVMIPATACMVLCAVAH